MKYASMLPAAAVLLAAVVQLGAANPYPDQCASAVSGANVRARSSHRSDCQSYLRCSTTTHVPTSTKSVTTTVTPAPHGITATTVLPGGSTVTTVLTPPQSLTTTQVAPPDATTTVTSTPPIAATVLTITPAASTVTVTVTPPATTIFAKRGQPTNPARCGCPTAIPSYAKKPCGGSADKYARACTALGAHRSTSTSTIYGTTRTVTCTVTAAPQQTTNVVTRPAPTVTVTETAPAPTSTVTIGAEPHTTTVTNTLPTLTSTSTTSLESSTTTTTTTVATPTVTLPVLCNNAGLQWAYFRDLQTQNSRQEADSYDPTLSKYYSPDLQGVTKYVHYSGNEGGPFGQSTGGNHDFFSLGFRGYLFLTEVGTYTFTMSNVDNQAFMWFGSAAYSGWYKGNADQRVVRSYDPPNYTAGSGTKTIDVTAADVFKYIPIRLVFANDINTATFDFSITSPSGATLLGSSPGAPDSFHVVQFSCNGISAPPYPPYGQET